MKPAALRRASKARRRKLSGAALRSFHGTRCYTSPVTDGRHAVAEDASLALHSAVAERIRADPQLIARARHRVEEWLRDGSIAKAYAEAWLEILDRPPDEVAGFLQDPGERARQLRQTSPFAGALDPRTRWAIWRRARRGTGPP